MTKPQQSLYDAYNDPDNAPENLGRRRAVKGIAGGLLASAVPTSQVFANDIFRPGNFFDDLSNRKFMDQKGNIITVDDLRRQMYPSPFTVHFGFSSCTQYCPISNKGIGILAEQHYPPIKHVVINVNPEGEGMDQAGRDLFHKTLGYENYLVAQSKGEALRSNGVNLNNVIVLFPCDNAGQLSNDEVIRSSIALKNVTDKSNTKNHTSNIAFYGSDGRFMTKSDSTEKAIREEMLPQVTQYYRGNGRTP